MIHRDKVNEIIRFAVVGTLATAVHYGIYYLFLLLDVFHPTIGYTVGYAVSFLLNFYLSNHFTFKTKPTLKKGLGFGLSHLINYLLHIILLTAFLKLGVNEKWAPLPVYVIVIPINFILVRTVLKSKMTD